MNRMNGFKQQVLQWLLAVLLLPALAAFLHSCVSKEYEEYITPPDDVRIGFTIRVNGAAGSASRGAGDPTEEGTALENKIDIENRDFRVYFYKTTDNTPIGQLEVITVENITDNDAAGSDFGLYNNDYYVVGKMTAEQKTALEAGFRMVVMANLNGWYKKTTITDEGFLAGDLPGYPTADNELSLFSNPNYYVSYTDGKRRYHNNTETGLATGGNPVKGYYVSEEKLIPMWGIQTYNAMTFNNEEVKDLDTPINLIRAFAKIELIPDEGMSLSNAKLKGYRNQFYMQQAQSEITSNGYQTFVDFATLNLYDGGLYEDAELDLKEVTENGTAKHILYIPEHEKDATKAPTSLTFHATFGNEATSDNNKFTVYFTDDFSQTGTMPDILRNHIYRFKIKVIEGKCTIKYQGIPWNEKTAVTITPGYDGSIYPTQN